MRPPGRYPGTRSRPSRHRLEGEATLEDHPYAGWVAAYADPAFQRATREAIALLDDAAAAADEATRQLMLTAFVDATWYEEQFWARAYALEAWPA